MVKPNEIRSFEELRENLRGIYELRPASDVTEVTASSEFYLCDRVIFSSFRFTPFQFDRNPKKLKEFDTEYLLIERYLAGEGHGIVADMKMAVNPQTFQIIDWSRRQRSITTHVTGQSFMIPHDLVDYDPSGLPPYFSISTKSTAGHLLEAVFDQFSAAAHGGRLGEASICSELCINLVKRLVHGVDHKEKDTADSRVGAALARRFVLRELADPRLEPDKVCTELNISRATLYRFFAEEGGVTRYIDKLRLQRCFDALLDAPSRRGEVRRIAESWGYHDAALFNKKFRRHFDIAPSDCLGSARSEQCEGTNICVTWPVNTWLKKV